MKKTDIILLTGLIASIIFTNFSDFGSTLNSIEHDVLRLHILANSDSSEDQQLKIQVRDKLLEKSEEFFGGCETLEQMKESAEEKKEEINSVVLDVIHENGFDYSANTQVVNMEFDTREYGDITMPTGDYDALRITIGDAMGHNWWCVMYPPLCLPAAENVESDNKKADEYFDKKQLDVMENPDDYQVKFKCVEWYKSIKKWFS